MNNTTEDSKTQQKTQDAKLGYMQCPCVLRGRWEVGLGVGWDKLSQAGREEGKIRLLIDHTLSFSSPLPSPPRHATPHRTGKQGTKMAGKPKQLEKQLAISLRALKSKNFAAVGLGKLADCGHLT